MLEFKSQREFVLEVLKGEINLRTNGTQYVPLEKEDRRSIRYREHMNSEGVPADIASAGYQWRPGTELSSARH